MFDLDKLSYQAYGNLVLTVLIVIAVLLNMFPFSLQGMIVSVIQIPIYLLARARFAEPIHARGLNVCFVLTTMFYILLFICIKGLLALTTIYVTIFFSTILTVLSCYVTSTLPNKMDKIGKLFFGYKKNGESKYIKLIDFIKFNGLNPELIEAENRLKDLEADTYLFYKRKFRENKTFKEIAEEFGIDDNSKIVKALDKAYYYIIGALKI